MIKKRQKKTKNRKSIIFLIILIALLLTGFSIGPIMSKVEIPKFRLLSTHDNIEIREYNAMLIAEVEIVGEREEAIGQGFKILADFIFGNNIDNNKIKMTAPVIQQPSKKIKMTAPVIQQPSDKGWKVSFVMPSSYSIDTLPKPINNKIEIKQIPENKMVVITFNGKNEEKNISKHEAKLMDFITKNNLKCVKAPIYAFYNPPWTLPILRKNEIMFEIL